MSLTQNKNVLTNIVELINFVQEQDNQRLFTLEEVEGILNNFDCDFNTPNDIKKLTQVQTIYSIIQVFFMRKAGVTKIRKEEESDDDFLASP